LEPVSSFIVISRKQELLILFQDVIYRKQNNPFKKLPPPKGG